MSNGTNNNGTSTSNGTSEAGATSWHEVEQWHEVAAGAFVNVGAVAAIDGHAQTRTDDKGREVVTRRGAPYSRRVMLDVVEREANGATVADLVLRGEDKHKVGNPRDDAAKRFWNGDDGAPVACSFASFDCKDARARADAAAADLVAFYNDANDADATSAGYGTRWDNMGTDARALVPHLVALFGTRAPSGACSWADHSSGTSKREAKRTQSAKQAAAKLSTADLVAEALKRDGGAAALLAQLGAADVDPAALQSIAALLGTSTSTSAADDADAHEVEPDADADAAAALVAALDADA